jgi:amino acid permease
MLPHPESFASANRIQGEMAAWLPLASGFTGFAHRFVDPALGFALGM